MIKLHIQAHRCACIHVASHYTYKLAVRVLLSHSSLQDHPLEPRQILSIANIHSYKEIKPIKLTFFLRSSSAISSLLRLVGWLSSSTIGAIGHVKFVTRWTKNINSKVAALHQDDL